MYFNCFYFLLSYSILLNSVKQVFEDLDFYGWYSTGNDVSEDDVKIHNQISSMVENPILLKLNTEFTPTSVSECLRHL